LVAKSITREQAERKKSQAAEFMDRIGDPDRADEFDDMSVEEYADHRGASLIHKGAQPWQLQQGQLKQT